MNTNQDYLRYIRYGTRQGKLVVQMEHRGESADFSSGMPLSEVVSRLRGLADRLEGKAGRLSPSSDVAEFARDGTPLNDAAREMALRWGIGGVDVPGEGSQSGEIGSAALAVGVPGVAPSQAQSFDVEAMLAECIPGGSICDPQQVADAIRAYLAAMTCAPGVAPSLPDGGPFGRSSEHG